MISLAFLHEFNHLRTSIIKVGSRVKIKAPLNIEGEILDIQCVPMVQYMVPSFEQYATVSLNVRLDRPWELTMTTLIGGYDLQ